MDSKKCHASTIPKASQEEDDKLFIATGFRYLHAFERGFPFPWCAKKSKKGWIVRDSPPSLSRQHPTETGVEFVGWREAEKMFRSREVLMQRVKNMDRRPIQNGHEHILNSSSDTDRIGRSARDSMNMNNGSSNLQYVACNKVHEWFRNTQRVIQERKMQASEQEFQSNLDKQKKKYRSELKEEQREMKRRQKELKEAEKLQSMLPEIESPTGSNNPVVHPPPMSPTRKKHKTKPPKPMQQLRNSVVLGEDPELDQMIEDVVFDFMHEFSKGQDGQANGNARSVQFDGNAMSVLREAAKDTLHTITNQDMNAPYGNHNIVTKKSDDADCSVILNTDGGSPSDNQLNDDADGTDERITAMIEQLIGEAQQDSDCQFDQRALDALREAAKEIVAMDKDVLSV